MGEADCGIPDNTAMQLLIPLACADDPACRARLAGLQLPHLQALLQRLQLLDADTGGADSLSPPHERALARLRGLPAAPDGCLPWAALDARERGLDAVGEAWAWITPVHWQVGAQQITMQDPRSLALDDAESQALRDAMAPYFAEDGLQLHPALPGRWLCSGAVLRDLPTAALDRVAGRDIGPWMPTVPTLRRLQNEMQMLLYTHPVNDARSARGLAPVNSFWVSGTGTLPAAPAAPAPVCADALLAPATAGDWAAWQEAWTRIDATACRALADALASTPGSRLVLCGERGALTFGAAQDTLWQRLRRRWRPPTLAALQEAL